MNASDKRTASTIVGLWVNDESNDLVPKSYSLKRGKEQDAAFIETHLKRAHPFKILRDKLVKMTNEQCNKPNE